MQLEIGTPKDARKIANIYRDAFPESVQLFFKKKPPSKLLTLLELSFRTVFYWGGQAQIAKDEQGEIRGYCFYLSTSSRHRKRNYRALLQTVPKIISTVGLSEVGRLLHNKLIMIISTRRKGKYPNPGARIISIAVDPASQGQGVGKLLLNAALAQIGDQRVGLNVRTDNPAGRHLYQEAGFVECGTTRDLSGEWLVLIKEP